MDRDAARARSAGAQRRAPARPPPRQRLEADEARHAFPPIGPKQIPRYTHDPEQAPRDQHAGPLALTIASSGIGHIVAADEFVRGDFAAAAV
jgi:hypothetical protein